MYTSIEAAAFQRDAVRLKLKYPAIFTEMPAEELAAIANGYGPENWDEELRNILSWIFRKYPVPAAIHDVRYEFSDGRELTRKAADAEFSANLQLVWQHNYGKLRFINPIAWYAYWKISTAAALTIRFGRSAWRSSYRKNQKECENE